MKHFLVHMMLMNRLTDITSPLTLTGLSAETLFQITLKVLGTNPQHFSLILKRCERMLMQKSSTDEPPTGPDRVLLQCYILQVYIPCHIWEQIFEALHAVIQNKCINYRPMKHFLVPIMLMNRLANITSPLTLTRLSAITVSNYLEGARNKPTTLSLYSNDVNELID